MIVFNPQRKSMKIPGNLLVASLIALVSVLNQPAIGQDEDPADYGPEKVVFEERAKKMPAAVLDHFRHSSSKGYRIPCKRCHHNSEGVEVEAACADCHGSERAGNVLSMKGAMHKNCVRCHLKANAKKTKGKRTAPTVCKSCHVSGRKAQN